MTTSAILALATGLPVIATRHSGFPDQVIEGKNGYLAEEGNYRELAELILRYMGEPERWASMGDFARAHMLATYDQKVLIDRQVLLYRRFVPNVKRVAFIVGTFPAISETWLIDQICDLIDRGIEVEIFAMRRGGNDNISERYYAYQLNKRTHFLEMPSALPMRFAAALPIFFRLLIVRPILLLRVFNFVRYGKEALSGKLLFRVGPLARKNFDLVHCHFGTVANRYLIMRDILEQRSPWLTTFYGVDISHIPKSKGDLYYQRLQKECPYFLVMSNNMKERAVEHGFEPSKIEPLPISVNVENFPFAHRAIQERETMEIATIGRFVEKKGFDDLLRATAILKNSSPRNFIVHIIGGGELDQELHLLAQELDIEDVVRFEGYMKLDDIPPFLLKMHLYVQPSKTSRSGDME